MGWQNGFQRRPDLGADRFPLKLVIQQVKRRDDRDEANYRPDYFRQFSLAVCRIR
jgi:hypothetical protein